MWHRFDSWLATCSGISVNSQNELNIVHPSTNRPQGSGVIKGRTGSLQCYYLITLDFGMKFARIDCLVKSILPSRVTTINIMG